jgi:hypothetical protein
MVVVDPDNPPDRLGSPASRTRGSSSAAVHRDSTALTLLAEVDFRSETGRTEGPTANINASNALTSRASSDRPTPAR